MASMMAMNDEVRIDNYPRQPLSAAHIWLRTPLAIPRRGIGRILVQSFECGRIFAKRHRLMDSKVGNALSSQFNRRTLAHRFGALIAMLLALGPAVIMTAPPAQAFTPSAAVTTAYEARLESLVNAQRTKYGLGRLVWASCPDRYAETWGAYLARTGLFAHRNQMTYLQGCKAQRVAENIARGNVSADRLVAAWMASPGHRKNILNGLLTRVGTGAVYARGQWTVTMNFSRP
jgi:hypothetical protein